MAEGIGIGDFSQGVDTAGVASYLSDIKSDSLDEAAKAVRDTKELETACNNNWEGQAREDFILKLQTAAEHLAQQYETLYKNLESQITQAAADMKAFDEGLL